MKTITQIADYCKEINIPMPRHPFFDIRRFEDNMRSVNAMQPAFRHEFYAIALRKSGTNREVNGQFLETNLFFNSPYQVISWDIRPDWEGWYIIFDREFLSMNPGWQNFILEYPFFRLDKSMPMDLSARDELFANELFNRIFEEYHGDNSDKFSFIQSYAQLLLLLTKRYFSRLQPATDHTECNRTADILLIARFQAFTESMIANEEADPGVRQPSFYAGKLNVHPNHLNAVARRITGKTATEIIQQQVISSARSLLRQTTLSIKEIAFRLHFTEPTHFNSFFKKHSGATPQQYRQDHRKTSQDAAMAT
jgi:AraC family transcriptional regulator, transcriptional activator of pobA